MSKLFTQSGAMPLPLRKHYGFAIFSDDQDILSHYLRIAEQLKQSHPNAYLTWFVSSANVAVVQENAWIDQVVPLSGDSVTLQAEVERLRHDRSWAAFYPAEPTQSSDHSLPSTLRSVTLDPLPTLAPCPEPSNPSSPKILLGQLGMNGDCLYATTLARQIKHDFPGCHLTWAIASACRSVIEENPYVDQIWEIHAKGWDQIAATWSWLVHEVRHQISQGRFDHVFLTQVYPDNSHNFDGTARPSLFRAYPHAITVPVQNILRLRQEEVDRVRTFAQQHRLTEHNPVILFEYTFSSQQSYINQDYALSVAAELVNQLPNASIILSSHRPIATPNSRIIDGSSLSLRETAELTKYCDLFIGCSSGITQVVLTDWAKPLPMIQLLGVGTPVFASIVHDLQYWGISTDTIIEMADASVETVVDCVVNALEQSVLSARQKFHQELYPDFSAYLKQIRDHTLYKGFFRSAVQAILNTAHRYGWQPELKAFVQEELFPVRQMRTLPPVSNEDCEKFLHSCMMTDVQTHAQLELNLREMSFISFPDWQQPLEVIHQTLTKVIDAVINHPQADQITLLIATHHIATTEADEIVAETVMSFFLEQELDVKVEPEISILPWLNEQQWQVLLSSVQARLTLPHEDQAAILEVGADRLPSLDW